MLGTAGMQRRARETDAREVVVATEVGLLHRLRAENPRVRFVPANPGAICRYMKLITPEKLERSLTEMVYEVEVPEDVARRARGAIERMIEIG
jgi:quinolinate synthase